MDGAKNRICGGNGALQVYLLGAVPFAALRRLQQRLHFDIAGDRSQAVLILCEHPPLITVGRQGSRAHILLEDQELRARQWTVQWLARGGGCLLHMPGQLAIYPIFPLDRLGLSVTAYLSNLGQVLEATLADFSLVRALERTTAGVLVGDRLVAALAVAVRASISLFGSYLNLDPDLEAFRAIRCLPGASEPMTSLARERRGLARPTLVRQRLLEHFQNVFGFDRLALFTDHPGLYPRAQAGTLPLHARPLLAFPGL